MTERFASLNRCGSVPYISRSSNFALYLEDWWMKVTLDIMDQCDTKIDHIKYI